MKTITIFFVAPFWKKRLFFQTIFCLYLFRIALWFVPFRYLYNFKVGQRYFNSTISIEDLIFFVSLSSNYVPQNTCLVRALSARALLNLYGYKSELHIGIAKIDGDFKAHAWLEHNNQVIIGELKDLPQYSCLNL